MDAIIRRQLARTPPSLATGAEFQDFVVDRMLAAGDASHRRQWLVDCVNLLYSWRGVPASLASSAAQTPSSGVQASPGMASSSAAPGPVETAPDASPGVAVGVVGDVNPGNGGASGRPFLTGVLRLLSRTFASMRRSSGASAGVLHVLSCEALAALPRVSCSTPALQSLPPATAGATDAAAATPSGVTIAQYVLAFLIEHCLFAVDVSTRGLGALCRGPDERGAGFYALRAVMEEVDELCGEPGDVGDGEHTATDVDRVRSTLLRDAFQSLCKFAKGSAAPLPSGYEWNYSPSEEGKGDAGFVGLRNLGSTCYVNSAVQQLFMCPTLCRGILSANPVVPKEVADAALAALVASGPSAASDGDKGSKAGSGAPPAGDGAPTSDGGAPTTTAVVALSAKELEEQKEAALLLQLQLTFVWLKYGAVRSFEPSAFVQSCSCLGLQYPVLHQNDAAEFVDNLVACLEKRVKGTPQVCLCRGSCCAPWMKSLTAALTTRCSVDRVVAFSAGCDGVLALVLMLVC